MWLHIFDPHYTRFGSLPHIHQHLFFFLRGNRKGMDREVNQLKRINEVPSWLLQTLNSEVGTLS